MTSDMASTARCILLTGATGFLGKVVLDQLLERGPADTIYVLVRGGERQSSGARFETKVRRSPAFALRKAGWSDGIRVVSGDLARPRCGLTEEDFAIVASSVTEIIHCAASIDFDLPIAAACEANITAALEVLELARSAPRLRRMVSVSTAYVTPHRATPIFEEAPAASNSDDPEALYAAIRAGTADERALLRASGHPNTYTFTKNLAERLLARRMGAVPLRIVRPSIISACRVAPVAGWIDSRAALAGFVGLVGAGYMRVVIANGATKLDVVPCDEVATRIVDEAFDDTFDDTKAEGLRVVHAVAGIERSLAIRDIGAVLLRHFGASPIARAPRIAYLGPRNALFAFQRLVHHVIPARIAALWCAMRGDARGRNRALRGVAKIDRVNELFAYFTQHTFDFRSSAPLDGGFVAERYFETICDGIATHLMPRKRAAHVPPALGSGEPMENETPRHAPSTLHDESLALPGVESR